MEFFLKSVEENIFFSFNILILNMICFFNIFYFISLSFIFFFEIKLSDFLLLRFFNTHFFNLGFKHSVNFLLIIDFSESELS